MRVRILFRKEEGARFLSHLDLMATIEYSMRRAGLPLEISEGFTPRPRFALAAPLPLGHLGEGEILEMTLRAEMDPEEVGRRLQAAVPRGLVVTGVQVVPPGQKAAAASVIGATYRVILEDRVPDLTERIRAVLARSEIPIREERRDGSRERDLRPLLRHLEALSGGDGFRLEVDLAEAGTVRPEQVLDLLEIDRRGATITREGLRLRDQ